MPIVTSGVEQSEIGPRFDVALGYSTDGTTAVMTGYLLSAGTTWSEKTDITDEEHIVQIASPSSSDRFGRYPTISQGDWSGGERQLYFNNANQFYTTDGEIDVTTPGQLQLLPSAQSLLPFPAGFTTPDQAPLATDGVNTYLGGSEGGVAYVYGPGGAFAVTGATGPITDMDCFAGTFYAVCGNGIWSFVSLGFGGIGSIAQVTSDVPNSAAAQTLAFFNGVLYYSDATQRKVNSAASALGAVPGTTVFTAPTLEATISVVASAATGIFIATSKNITAFPNANETVVRIFDGANATIIGTIRGNCARARNVNGALYVLSADPQGYNYLLYRIENGSVTLLDDTRYLLSDFAVSGGFQSGSFYFGAHLWDDGRFLYIGWPSSYGLRYDTGSGSLSRYGSPSLPFGVTYYSSHRIVNEWEVITSHSRIAGHPQQVIFQQWTGAPTSGALTTSFFDATVPLLSKRWAAVEFQLAQALPAGGSLQVAFKTDQQTAFSAPITAVATGSTYTVYLPTGTIAHRIQFQITLTAGGGVSPVVAFYDVRFTLGRVLEFTVACDTKQKLRDASDDTKLGTDKLAVIDNIRRLAGGDAVLFIPSATAGPGYVEQISAKLVDYNDTRSRPAARDGQDMPFDIEADVRLTFAESL